MHDLNIGAQKLVQECSVKSWTEGNSVNEQGPQAHTIPLLWVASLGGSRPGGDGDAKDFPQLSLTARSFKILGMLIVSVEEGPLS